MRWLLRTDTLFLAVLFLGIFGMAARNVSDPDLWWHLKTGQHIAESKTVPHVDFYSYTRSGQPWVAHEWLSELFLYQLERTLGFGGLIVVFAAILSATFVLLYLRCGDSPYIAGLATLWAAWATRPVWGVRPQVLSLLLTGLWLLILERSERTPKLLWWTLAITLLWVNLHAGFALGLVLSALFLLGDWIEHRLGFSASNKSRIKLAALILLLDLLIVPVNPNGLRMFSYPVETLRSAAMQRYIAEWFSPNFHRPEYWPFLVVILVTFAILIWCRQEVRPRDVLLLLVSLYAGLCSIRMIPLFVLIAVPLIARRLGNWPARHNQPLFTGARALLHTAIILAMTIFVASHIVQVIHRQAEAEAQHFPVGAVAYLQAHPPTSPIFNHYDWGGYLIWRLYPFTPVFIDGRADLYGEKLFDQFANTYQFKNDWRQTLQRWNIGTVLVPAQSPLATGLRNSPDWTISYEDSQAVVLTARPHSPAAGVPSPLKDSTKRAPVTIGTQESTPVTTICRLL